ncbi:MAG: hypothetical protein ABH823_00375 [bacterium]
MGASLGVFFRGQMSTLSRINGLKRVVTVVRGPEQEKNIVTLDTEGLADEGQITLAFIQNVQISRGRKFDPGKARLASSVRTVVETDVRQEKGHLSVKPDEVLHPDQPQVEEDFDFAISPSLITRQVQQVFIDALDVALWPSQTGSIVGGETRFAFLATSCPVVLPPGVTDTVRVDHRESWDTRNNAAYMQFHYALYRDLADMQRYARNYGTGVR